MRAPSTCVVRFSGIVGVLAQFETFFTVPPLLGNPGTVSASSYRQDRSFKQRLFYSARNALFR
jgi:hypothetical protein